MAQEPAGKLYLIWLVESRTGDRASLELSTLDLSEMSVRKQRLLAQATRALRYTPTEVAARR